MTGRVSLRLRYNSGAGPDVGKATFCCARLQNQLREAISMTDEPKGPQPPVIPLRDPDNVPVRIVNQTLNLGFVGSLFEAILATSGAGVGPDGQLQAQHTIAARLRFDIDFARAFHAQFGQAIEALTAPPKDQVN